MENLIPSSRRFQKLETFNEVLPSIGLPKFLIQFVSPDGVTFDVTDRDMEIGSINEVLEEDLTELTHSDMDLVLDNSDGAIEDYFRDSKVDEVWKVEVWRESTRRSRVTSELVFTGILDLPFSLEYSRSDMTVSVQAFSATKLLESISAETIKRNVPSRIAEVASGASTIKCDPTDIEPLDEVRFEDGSVIETQKVKELITVASAGFDGLEVTENFTNAFTDARMVIATPFKRFATIEELVQDIADAAGINTIDVRLKQAPIDIPFPSAFSGSGLDSNRQPRGLTKASFVVSTGLSVQGTPLQRRYTATDAQSGWLQGSAFEPWFDWQPYVDSESLLAVAALASDVGSIEATAGDNVGVCEGILHTDNNTIWNWDKVSGNIRIRESFSTVFTFVTNTRVPVSCAIEHVPEAINNKSIWVMCKEAPLGTPPTYTDDGRDSFSLWDTVANSETVIFNKDTSGTKHVGTLRFMRLHGNHMLCHELKSPSMHNDQLWIYDAEAIDGSLSTPLAITVPEGLLVWTMRAIPSRNLVAGIYQEDGKSFLKMWKVEDIANWTPVVDVRIANTALRNVFLTNYVLPETNENVVIGYNGDGNFFIVSEQQSGVVTYADFTGMSCAAALKEVALAASAYAKVGEDGDTIIIRSRIFDDETITARVIDEPLQQTTNPVWELFRSGVTIEGNDLNGVAFEQFIGTLSSRNQNITTKIVRDLPSAAWIANSYVNIQNVEREQRKVVVRETDEFVHALDLVELDSRRWLVIEAATDLKSRIHDLVLVSVT